MLFEWILVSEQLLPGQMEDVCKCRLAVGDTSTRLVQLVKRWCVAILGSDIVVKILPGQLILTISVMDDRDEFESIVK